MWRHLLPQHGRHLIEEAPEAILQRHNLAHRLLQRRGEAEQPQRVSRGRGVEDHHVIIHALHLAHELCEAHGFVDAGNAGGHVHEKSLDPLPFLLRASLGSHQLLLEVLHGAGRLDLHAEQVVKAVDQRRLSAELLRKGVAQVVRGVRGNHQDRAAHRSESHRGGARHGGLAHAPFPTDEHPLQLRHVHQIAQRGLQILRLIKARHQGSALRHGLRMFESHAHQSQASQTEAIQGNFQWRGEEKRGEEGRGSQKRKKRGEWRQQVS
eukprot:scaffold7052_cov254-Pinguiococcus_pyrenoidosus.AAC.13